MVEHPMMIQLEAREDNVKHFLYKILNKRLYSFKESHTYTTIGSYTYVDEHAMEGEFDFPVYANFGLEENFKKLKLNLNC